MVTSYENKVEVKNSKKENIELSLPSKPEYVSIARLTASVISNKMGFNIEDIEDIKIAVGEACNNAVIHGSSNSLNQNFDLNFTVEDEKIEINIIDKGNGFRVEKCANPDLCNPKENGLGIFIIKSLMDEVEVQSSPGNGTGIRMVKYLYKY